MHCQAMGEYGFVVFFFCVCSITGNSPRVLPSGKAGAVQIGRWITQVVDGLAANDDDNGKIEARVASEVEALCKRFPICPGL